MLLTIRAMRRVVAATIGVGAIAGATLFGAVPSALADPPPPAPGCSAADFEQVTGEVSTATSAYFFAHPDVNAFFSTLRGLPRDQVKQEIKDYGDAHPQTKSDLDGIRQPLHDMKARCQ